MLISQPLEAPSVRFADLLTFLRVEPVCKGV